MMTAARHAYHGVAPAPALWHPATAAQADADLAYRIALHALEVADQAEQRAARAEDRFGWALAGLLLTLALAVMALIAAANF